MSEQATAETTETTESAEAPIETEEPQGTEETDWKAEARKWERRAKDNAKYREAADKWADYEKSLKPEQERMADELDGLRKEAATAKLALLRYEVAKEKQVPLEAVRLLSGETKEELEEAADSLLTLIESQTQKSPKPDSTQGQPVRGGGTTADQFAAVLSDLL